MATSLSASTTAGTPVAVTLAATDADGNSLTLRIVSQPANGTVEPVRQDGHVLPIAGFSGSDTFTYAAWDGSIDSNLATVAIQVTPGGCTLTATASAPSTAAVGTAVSFTASASASGCIGPVTFDWNFGDGTAHSTQQNTSHAYASAGTFTWTMTASADGVSSARSGSIAVSAPAAPAPTITRVRAFNNPFSIEITGTGFQPGVAVYIGTDTNPWQPTQRPQQHAAGAHGQRPRHEVPAADRRAHQGRQPGWEICLNDIQPAPLAGAPPHFLETGLSPRQRRRPRRPADGWQGRQRPSQQRDRCLLVHGRAASRPSPQNAGLLGRGKVRLDVAVSPQVTAVKEAAPQGGIGRERFTSHSTGAARSSGTLISSNSSRFSPASVSSAIS